MKKLSSKCAVITGAASGLGYALARVAIENDMNVVASDIDAGLLKAAVSSLSNNQERIVSVAADVAKYEDVALLSEAAEQRFGGTDLLINNAGRMLNKFTWEHSPTDWHDILGVNVGGVTNALSIFVPKMIDRGTASHVVNIGSLASFLPSPLMCSYTASKFSVLAISETLKYELDSMQHPIAVSFVAPGPVDTAIFRDNHAQQKKALKSEQGEVLRQDMAKAIKAFGMPADLAAEIIFNGIQADKFWIYTHPELLKNLPDRATAIMRGDNPVYQNPALLD